MWELPVPIPPVTMQQALRTAILEVIGRVYSLVKSNIIYKFSSSTLMRMCTHSTHTYHVANRLHHDPHERSLNPLQ